MLQIVCLCGPPRSLSYGVLLVPAGGALGRASWLPVFDDSTAQWTTVPGSGASGASVADVQGAYNPGHGHGYPDPAPPPGLGPGQGHFPCPKCGKVYLHLPSLWNHKTYQCGKEPQFACPLCGKLFRFKAHRKRHVLKQHGGQGLAAGGRPGRPGRR